MADPPPPIRRVEVRAPRRLQLLNDAPPRLGPARQDWQDNRQRRLVPVTWRLARILHRIPSFLCDRTNPRIGRRRARSVTRVLPGGAGEVGSAGWGRRRGSGGEQARVRERRGVEPVP
jgi:hypothetical protein